MILCIKLRITTLFIWIIIKLIIIIYLLVCHSLIFFFTQFIIKKTTCNRKKLILIVLTINKSLCSLKNYNIFNNDDLELVLLIGDYISCHKKQLFNLNTCNRYTQNIFNHSCQCWIVVLQSLSNFKNIFSCWYIYIIKIDCHFTVLFIFICVRSSEVMLNKKYNAL